MTELRLWAPPLLLGNIRRGSSQDLAASFSSACIARWHSKASLTEEGSLIVLASPVLVSPHPLPAPWV